MQAIDPAAQVDYMKGFTGTGTTARSCCATVDPAAIAAASGYNAVLVVVGTDSSTGQEDHDRTTSPCPAPRPR